mmetsp:Transcript_22657/g.49245  ORF Transcript_22657/g.49245 Transcript_22657/m.49245 type:complete len:82 (+) Transcript_22657:215-460(+)
MNSRWMYVKSNSYGVVFIHEKALPRVKVTGCKSKPSVIHQILDLGKYVPACCAFTIASYESDFLSQNATSALPLFATLVQQ